MGGGGVCAVLALVAVLGWLDTENCRNTSRREVGKKSPHSRGKSKSLNSSSGRDLMV